MNNPERDLRHAALVFVKKLLNLKKGQRLLVYIDQGSDLDVAEGIQDAALEIGALTEILELASNLKLSDLVEELVCKIEKRAYDVICELSEQYFYPTLVWEMALQLGSQIYSFGAVNTDAFVRCVGKVDHDLMFQFGMVLKAILEKSKTLHIITKQGTNIRLRINSDNLLLKLISKLKKRQKPFVLYPSGALQEVTRATFMGGQLAFQGFPETINGKAVIDAYLWPPSEIGRLDSPIIMKIKKGNVIAINGLSSKSKFFDEWLQGLNREIQHFCIGFNPGAKLTGSLIEAERVFGYITIGIGKYPFHSDGVIKDPSILLNDQFIEQEGSFIQQELAILQEKLLRDTLV